MQKNNKCIHILNFSTISFSYIKPTTERFLYSVTTFTVSASIGHLLSKIGSSYLGCYSSRTVELFNIELASFLSICMSRQLFQQIVVPTS